MDRVLLIVLIAFALAVTSEVEGTEYHNTLPEHQLKRFMAKSEKRENDPQPPEMIMQEKQTVIPPHLMPGFPKKKREKTSRLL